MNNFRKLAGGAGVLFVLAFVLGFVVAGSIPKPSDSGEKVIAYFLNHHRGLQGSVILTALGLFLFIFFLVGLWNVFRASAGGQADPWTAVAVIGGAAAAVAGVLQAAVYGGLIEGIGKSTQASTTSIDVARTVYRMAWAVGGAGAVFIALFTLAAGVVTIKHAVMPAWIGWLAILAAILQAISAISIASVVTVFLVFTIVASLVSLVWVLIVSIWMWRTPAGAEPQVP